jgi:hypothetical protein
VDTVIGPGGGDGGGATETEPEPPPQEDKKINAVMLIAVGIVADLNRMGRLYVADIQISIASIGAKSQCQP